jgi:hypothetical protein
MRQWRATEDENVGMNAIAALKGRSTVVSPVKAGLQPAPAGETACPTKAEMYKLQTRFSRALAERMSHDRLSFRFDALQVVAAAKALGVNLVDLLGARWPRGEPASIGDHLHAADRIAVTWRFG